MARLVLIYLDPAALEIAKANRSIYVVSSFAKNLFFSLYFLFLYLQSFSVDVVIEFVISVLLYLFIAFFFKHLVAFNFCQITFSLKFSISIQCFKLFWSTNYVGVLPSHKGFTDASKNLAQRQFRGNEPFVALSCVCENVFRTYFTRENFIIYHQ